ncbi:retropepsin-like aspartic protease family protein [Halomonas sp. WWR20]
MNDETRAVRRTGLGMMLLFWMILLGFGAWWFQGLFEARHNPNADLVQTEEGSQLPVTLERNASGHFIATGRINGEPVDFLLDTGASYVAVPEALAERLGLQRGASANFNTANGRVQGHLTQIERISLGGLTAHQVRGSINPGFDGDIALLGMSFLNRFDIQIRGDEMILRPADRS